MNHRTIALAAILVGSLVVRSAPSQASSHYLTPESPMPHLNGGVWFGVAVADFNNDGRDDFVMVNSQHIYTFLTTPAGTIGPWIATQGGVGVDLYMPVAGDFNQDGNMDLVVYSGWHGQQRVFLGNGNGAFSYLQDLPVVPLNGIHHRVADLDNDGRPEILVYSGLLQAGGYDHYIFSFDQQLALFIQSTIWTLPIAPPMVADVDGDGSLDLIAGSTTPGLLYACLGDGNLGFGSPIAIPHPLPPGTNGSVYSADIDLDGRADIVINHYPSTTQLIAWRPSQILVGRNLLASPNWTTFPSPGIQSGGYWSDSLHIRDINGDGFPDIVGTQIGNLGTLLTPIDKTRMGVMLGDGAGSFSPPMIQEIAGNTQITNSGMADLDLDGDPDFFGLDYPFYDFITFRNMSRFGRGCSTASIGAPIMSSNLLTPGNSAFQMQLSNAPAFAPCLLAISRAAYVSNTGSCQVGVDFSLANLILPLGAFGITSTDGLGSAAINLPIPADPALIALTLYAQWGVVDPFAPGGIALTQAGTFIIW